MRLVASNDLKHRMMAEQTVARMNNAMRYKLGEDAKEGLIQALTRVSATDGLSFTNNPFRQVPPRWSFSGMLSRLLLRIRRRKSAHDDGALADAHIDLKRSGISGLVIALLIALVVGITEFGEPAELGLQTGRDALRQTAASGDIVILTKDDSTAEHYGGALWARKYDAQLVDRLREMGVKQIVYTQVMAEPTNAADDAALAAAFDRAKGKIWLAAEAADASNATMKSPVVPLLSFRDKAMLAHGNARFGIFGQLEYVPAKVGIDGAPYPAQAEILAGVQAKSKYIKPDYAISFRSIPTLAAADVMTGKIAKGALAGKTVLVTVSAQRYNREIRILGQGRSSDFYSVVIAAETLKRGMPLQLGFLIPLALVAAAGLWWVSRRTPRARMIAIAAGFGALIALILVGDRFGLHFDMVPALLALGLFVHQQSRHGRIAAALTAHPVSGLPSISHLSLIKDKDPRSVIAMRFERYPYITQRMKREDEQSLALAIAARVNIIAPHAQVYQGDNGLFLFLAEPDGEVDVEIIAPQIEALFKVAIISIHAPHDLGVAIGINDDRAIGLSYRVSLAIDRAELGAYAPTRLIVG